MPQPGDFVVYTGTYTRAQGRKGIVSDKFRQGKRYFGYTNANEYDPVPVVFHNPDGTTFIYEAWYKNLTIVGQKPIWEI